LQKTIGCSNPKNTTPIFGKAACIVAGERGVVLLVEGGELDAVEAGDASFGSDPEVSITSLEYLVNTVLRETVVARPSLMPQGRKKGRFRESHVLLRIGPRVCGSDRT
jgi:hypothetical protein